MLGKEIAVMKIIEKANMKKIDNKVVYGKHVEITSDYADGGLVWMTVVKICNTEQMPPIEYDIFPKIAVLNNYFVHIEGI